jgi:hypothetical protein
MNALIELADDDDAAVVGEIYKLTVNELSGKPLTAAEAGIMATSRVIWGGVTPQLTGGLNCTPIIPISTDVPGSGYKMSSPSVVSQPFETLSRLATNIWGRVLWRFPKDFRLGAYLFFLAPVIVAGPQFM